MNRTHAEEGTVQGWRAVVVAVDPPTDFEAGQCSTMMPLIDRPFLQHIVECLVERGFTRIDLLLHDMAGLVEAEFGDGERWGVELRYHLVRDPKRPYERAARIEADSDCPFLVVDANFLQPEAWRIPSALDLTAGPISHCWVDEAGQDHWAGSAWLLPGMIREVAEATDLIALLLDDRGGIRRQQVSPPLRADGFQGLLSSQQRVLAGEFPELMRQGKRRDNIWIQRNTRIHPSARITPPVFIGPNCEIEARVSLGPNVVVGDSCILRQQSEVQESLVMPESLIGEGLTIDGCLLDQGTLFHVGHDLALRLEDELLIGSVNPALSAVDQLASLLARLAALGTLCAALPVLLVAAAVQKLRLGRAFDARHSVQLPAAGPESQWKSRTIHSIACRGEVPLGGFAHLLLHFLPGLWYVVKGELCWVGVEPVSADDLKAMPSDWRDVYRKSEVGLVTESRILYGAAGNREQRLAAEVCFAVTRKSLLSRIRRVAVYCSTLVSGPLADQVQGKVLPTRLLKAMVRLGFSRSSSPTTEDKQWGVR